MISDFLKSVHTSITENTANVCCSVQNQKKSVFTYDYVPKHQLIVYIVNSCTGRHNTKKNEKIKKNICPAV